MTEYELENILSVGNRLDDETNISGEWLVIEVKIRENTFSLKNKISPHEIVAIIKTPKRIHPRNIDFIEDRVKRD